MISTSVSVECCDFSSWSKKLLRLNVPSLEDVRASDTTSGKAEVLGAGWGVDASAGRIWLVEGTGRLDMVPDGITTGTIPTGCGGT